MINNLKQRAQSPEISNLRVVIDNKSIADALATIKRLDSITRAALNLNVNHTRQLFSQSLVCDYINNTSKNWPYIASDSLMLGDMLSALEVGIFNIYDLNGLFSFNLLDYTVNELLLTSKHGISTQRERCLQAIGVVASRVSHIDQFQESRDSVTDKFQTASKPRTFFDAELGAVSPLMRMISATDIDAVSLLIEHGANPEALSKKGVSGHQLAKIKVRSDPEFYLDYRALMLTKSHHVNNAPIKPKRL